MSSDYRYEGLGDDRFQKLCQALLAKSDPTVQCLPTGQGDGGRDVIRGHLNGRQKLTVFQVKFTAHPDKIKDKVKWLADLLKSEQPKIQQLVARGLKRYYIVTNVSGSATLGSGSIDRVAELLKQTVPVPSFCWWRDDLNRRVDDASDIKWAYPEILSGVDVIALLATSGLAASDQERVLDTIKGYVRKQYDDEQDVRFREVDLRHSLFGLFVDVPASVRSQSLRGEQSRRSTSVMFTIAREHREALARVSPIASNHSPRATDDDERRRVQVGGAAFLLHRLSAREFPRLVLEGAPGQGKSTVVQFVCQVHRRRLIKVDADLPSNLKAYDESPLRIPFKVDLRDLALWLNGIDPFSIKRAQKISKHAARTAEGFLAAQVAHLSGGGPFTVADLRSLAKTSPLLLVFDGLDEVADIPTRRGIVEEVKSAAHRLQDIGKDVQVVVTSRPSAYANSPGFPESDFRYCELESLTRTQIEGYGQLWAHAKGLAPKDAAGLLGVLNAKLAEPHIRDLARNPMQLSILLSLLHTQGMSLPDKRTAIYDSYVQLFLNREAEKSPVVREHRDLLVDIHRFIAWKLHTEAETGHGRGSISRDDLLKTLREYLELEGRDIKLAITLFQGMVERVVALVQRVQGMYEFEVQPLREYFCARYLYDTAPHSREGTQALDSTVDRFDVLARNSYWLNVVRFFAGCFNKGELPALVSSIRDLLDDAKFGRLSTGRELGVLLLRDWVLSQHVRATRELVELVTDPVGLRFAFTSDSSPIRGAGRIVKLPPQCGQDVLVQRCKDVLVHAPPAQYSREVARILAANTSESTLTSWWQSEAKTRRGPELTRWIRTGVYIEVLPHVPAVTLAKFLVDGEDADERRACLLSAGAFRFIESSLAETRWAVQAILGTRIIPGGDFSHPLSRLARNLATLMQVGFYYSHYPVGMARDLISMHGASKRQTSTAKKVSQQVREELDHVRRFNEVVVQEMQKTPLDWQSDLEPWVTIIDAGRTMWGDQLGMLLAAFASVVVDSKTITNTSAVNLDDSAATPAARVQAARNNAADEKWWRHQFRRVPNADLAVWTLSLLKLVATGNVVAGLAPEIDRLLRRFGPIVAIKLVDSPFPSQRHFFTRSNRGTKLDAASLPTRLQPETVVFLAHGEAGEVQLDLYRRYLTSYRGDSRFVQRFCVKSEFALAPFAPGRWESAVDLCRRRYGTADGQLDDVGELADLLRRRGRYALPLALATQISQHAEFFPWELVSVAQRRLRSEALRGVEPVGQIAAQRAWTPA